jgi:hypothetical protein
MVAAAAWDELEGTLGAPPADVLEPERRGLATARSYAAQVRHVLSWASHDPTIVQSAEYVDWTAAPQVVGLVPLVRMVGALACDVASGASFVARRYAGEHPWCAEAVAHANAAGVQAAALCANVAGCSHKEQQGDAFGTTTLVDAQGNPHALLDTYWSDCVLSSVDLAAGVLEHAQAALDACHAPARAHGPRRAPLEAPSSPATFVRTLAPSTLGDAATDAQLAQIESELGPAVSPADLQHIVSTYTGLSAAQQGAIVGATQSLVNGNIPSLGQLAPLLAGSLAITGVAAPIVAVVAVALPLLAPILAALGITPGTQQCTWKVGGLCVNAKIPYGPVLAPGDPHAGWPNPAWTRFYDFVAANAPPGTPQSQGIGGTKVEQAFPWYRITIGCEVPILDAQIILSPPKDPSELQKLLFLRGFYALWVSNAEKALNGHPAVGYGNVGGTDSDLLASYAAAWNASHEASSQWTIQPWSRGQDAGYGAVALLNFHAFTSNRCAFKLGDTLTDPGAPTYVALLLAGNIDGRSQPPLIVNTGAAHYSPPVPGGAAGGGGGGGGGGAAGTVAVVAGAGALGALGWALLKGGSLLGAPRR